MWIIKIILLCFIFCGSSLIGMMIANKYKNRTNELYEFKKALNFFISKIEYTYEPVQDIFYEIAENSNENISNIFNIAAKKTEEISAEDAWNYSVSISKNSFNKDDIQIIKDFGKTLGQTNIDGQLNKTKLTLEFLNKQIEDSEREQDKNEKLYKTLGIIAGMGLVIILI